MAPCGVVVLYEDQYDNVCGFGLHKLVIRLVTDKMSGGCPLHDIQKRITGHPTKGNSKLLQKARAVDVIAQRGEAVVAVLDDDQVRAALRLPADACKRDVVAMIRAGCSDPKRVRTVLLESNIETVIEALRPHASALGIAFERFDNAIKRKNLNDRDLILGAASREDNRSIRDALIDSVPSLRRLRDQVRGAAGLE